nr:Uma2 family endonuclease [Pseudanabaena sp. PCC 6802]
MAVTTDKWTVERYHQAIKEGLFQDVSVELLQGEIVLMPSEGVPHAYSNTEVADYLRTLLGDRAKIRDAIAPAIIEPTFFEQCSLKQRYLL